MSTDYTHEDFNRARLHGSYANAAAIALALSRVPDLDSSRAERWFATHELMLEKAAAYAEGYATAKKETGRTDIHGRMVCAGDKVWLYPQDYEVISVDSSGDIPVQEVDSTKPKPVADTPVVRGVVVWCVDSLQWRVQVSWQMPTWDSIKYASIALAHYAVEVHPEEAA